MAKAYEPTRDELTQARVYRLSTLLDVQNMVNSIKAQCRTPQGQLDAIDAMLTVWIERQNEKLGRD